MKSVTSITMGFTDWVFVAMQNNRLGLSNIESYVCGLADYFCNGVEETGGDSAQLRFPQEKPLPDRGFVKLEKSLQGVGRKTLKRQRSAPRLVPRTKTGREKCGSAFTITITRRYRPLLCGSEERSLKMNERLKKNLENLGITLDDAGPEPMAELCKRTEGRGYLVFLWCRSF